MELDLETLALPSSGFDLQPPPLAPGPLVAERMAELIEEDEALAPGVSTNVPANVGTVGDTNYQDEVHVAAHEERVLVGFNDSRGFAMTPWRITGWSYSSDGGRTWAVGQLLPIVPGLALTRGDPVIAAFDERRWLFATIAFESQTQHQVIAVYRSQDRGRNFNQASIATNNHSAQSFMDKEWMAVDNREDSDFRRNVYVTFTNFQSDGRSIIQLARSQNLGVLFANPITLSANQPGTQTQFSQVAVGHGGQVFVTFWWGGDGGANLPGHYFVRSTDGGATFSNPQRVLPTTKPGHFNTVSRRFELNGFVRVAEIATLAVDPEGEDDDDDGDDDGNILHLVATSHGQGNDEADILYVRSADGGNTWSNPITLNDDNTTTDQFFPSVATGEDGVVCATWYDRRNDANNLRIEVFGRISEDRGRTWGNSFEVTDITPGFLPQTSSSFNYMGDYTGSAWAEDRFVIGWGDNRSGVMDDTYTARVRV